MSIRDLMRKGQSDDAARWQEDKSLFSFQRDMNRLFDDFFGEFNLVPARSANPGDINAFIPRINLAETDKEICITAELPGMDEKDVHLEVEEDSVTISGEKKVENEEKGKNWRRIEHSYGSFCRVIPLPVTIDTTRVAAKIKKGVLNVTLPKTEVTQPKKKTVEIKPE